MVSSAYLSAGLAGEAGVEPAVQIIATRVAFSPVAGG